MRNKNILYSFLSSLGVLIYVSGVAWFLSNGEKIFGKSQSMGMPVAFLLVFVLSAAITGSLVFGYPVWQYLDGKKKEALKALGWNLGFLAIFTILALVLIAI
ncbi:MAG: hypothetical protein WCW31_05295 [Patescibacteria group bacterium]|jgi:hypothetical protein